MARMKVVLRQDVSKLGDVGQVVTVAGGFARNYLIPRGIAVPATKGNVKHSETWRDSKVARSAREVREASDVKARLEGAPLAVSAQAGPDGRLFGSITSAQIAEVIASAHGLTIDRHDIELTKAIKHLGFHEARVRLHGGVVANVTVEAVEG